MNEEKVEYKKNKFEELWGSMPSFTKLWNFNQFKKAMEFAHTQGFVDGLERGS